MTSKQDEKKSMSAEVIITPDGSGYNSWPFICAIGNRLVCVYSRGTKHSLVDPARGTFARVSDDGGKTWLAETTVVNSSVRGEIAEGSGLDGNGAMLLFVFIAEPKVKHHLYRSTDGVNFVKIAELSLDPNPIQIMDIVKLCNGDLMALWFAGDYTNTKNGSWGTLISSDNGITWRQQTIESGLSKEEWPTEQSLIANNDGRLIGIARMENSSASKNVQFQLESDDNGMTWKKYHTNISDILESTPALLYDKGSGLISNYYYQREKGILRRRSINFEDIWHNALHWPPSEIVTKASTDSCHAGNVKGTFLGEKHALALYSGHKEQTAIVTLVIPRPVKESISKVC